MAKKRAKKTTKTTTVTKTTTSSKPEIQKTKKVTFKSQDKAQQLLIENFINLQRKLVDTTRDLKELKNSVSELLTIFKRAEEEFKSEKHVKLAPKIEEKLDQLIEQDKLLAEGIVAIGENMKVEVKRAKRKPKKDPFKDKQEEEEEVVVEKDEVIEKHKPHKKDEEEDEEDEDNEELDMEPLPEFNF